MPPFVHPSFELIEARSWAADTVDQFLTDFEPIIFQSTAPSSTEHAKKVDLPNPRKNTRPNPIRRSLSLLETNLFSSSNPHRASTPTEQRSNTLREKPRAPVSSSLPPPKKEHTSFITATATTTSSSSSSLPDQSGWTFDRSVKIFLLFSSPSCAKKERQGRAIWEKSFQASLKEKPALPSIPPQITDPNRSVQLKRYITTELLTTEETYLDHLTIIKRVFMDPMMEATTAHLASVKDLQTIFAFIPQLLMLSTSLLRRLHDADTIGKVFCDHLSHFDVYISYAAHFAKAQKCVSKANSRSIIYRQLVMEKRMNRMGLPDYAIAPIQRITRYCMLLKDIKKHSSPVHPDYPFIERALKCLTALALAMNNIQ